MTLIVAAQSADFVLIAADSKEINTDNRSDGGTTSATVDKLIALGDHVIWGYEGDRGIGEPFRDVVEDLAPFADWGDLAIRCGPELRALNVTDPRVQNQVRRGTSAIFAGFLGGGLGIVEITQWGNSRRRGEWGSVGWGRLAADVAWAAVGSASQLTIEDRFRIVVEASVAGIDGLEGPISAWRITMDGPTRPWDFGLEGGEP